MKKNSLLIVIVAVIIISIISLMVYKAKNKSESDDVIRIGAILPLTGSQSQDGSEVKNAIVLAVNEINNYQNANCKIDINICDSKDNSKEAITIFNAMMGNRPDVVIVGGSVVSLSVAPLANKYKIPILSLLACDDALPNENDWMFRSFPSDKEEIGLMVRYSVEKLNVRKLASLTVDNIQGKMAIKYIKEFAEKLHCEICAEETYLIDAMDARSQVSKIIKTNPDSIYVFGYGIGFSTSINQIRELGYTKSILTWSAMSLVANQEALKGNKANIYYTAPQFSRDLSNASRKFYDQYIEAYKKQPGFVAAFAYETVRMIEMVSKPNGHSAESLCSGLKGINNYESITGEIGFNGHRGLQTVFGVFKIDDGKIVRIQ